MHVSGHDRLGHADAHGPSSWSRFRVPVLPFWRITDHPGVASGSV